MKELLKRGATSNILRVFLQDSTVTTGAGKTGLTNASSGLIISTIADLEATATTYTSAASNVETITTLGTFAAPTAGKCRFKEVDATNFPGVYEIQIADARFNVSNSTQLLVSIQCTGVAPVFAEYQLIAVDLLDTVRLGLTAIPNVAQGTSGALPTGNATGQVTVATNNDKTGYSLTQAFPANFASLAINGGGAVTAGTVSDKTGYSLTQTFPTNFSSLAITAGGIVTANTTQLAGQTVTAAAGVTFPASVSSLTAANVWDTNISGYTTTGYAGTYLKGAGTAGDPWSTALPGAYGAGTAGYIVGTNLNATITSRMATFTLPTNFSSLAITGGGAVTAGTVSDKTGYSLTQAFPSNFSSLAITAGGAVTAGTVSDKTGYSLTQAFPSNFSSMAITAGGAVTVGTNNDKTGYSLTTTPPTANSIADAVWGADKDTPYAGGTYGNTTFGRRVLRGASTQADVSVTGSNHVAADIHELQPAVISAGDFSAGAIDANALATDAVTEIAQGVLTEATSTTTYAAGDVGNILGRLHNMIEADGVDFRYTTNSLEQAPSSGAGAWQLNAAQTTGLKRMITAIVGIGGETATPGVLEFGMVGDTTTLQITQSVDGNDRLTVQEI